MGYFYAPLLHKKFGILHFSLYNRYVFLCDLGRGGAESKFFLEPYSVEPPPHVMRLYLFEANMEYSDIVSEISTISNLIAGTSFAETLPDAEKWQIYERFKQHIQMLPYYEYEEAVKHATDILEL